ncbi:thiamine phosphate synthase [Rickettsiales bacterium]|nr:thiamine phosphate synthase [Rickettsiales bacterium]
MNNLPNKWFFLDSNKKESISILYHITNKDGVIFFNNQYNDNYHLLKKTEKLINFCRKNNISFLFPCSITNALKFKACGVYLPLSKYRKDSKNKLSLINTPPDFVIATSVHNYKEILISNKLKYNIVFISPAFTTMSHKEMAPHNAIKFINLCKFSNAQVFALGGINKKNFQRLKNKHLNGFGAITYFKNKTTKL